MQSPEFLQKLTSKCNNDCDRKRKFITYLVSKLIQLINYFKAQHNVSTLPCCKVIIYLFIFPFFCFASCVGWATGHQATDGPISSFSIQIDCSDIGRSNCCCCWSERNNRSGTLCSRDDMHRRVVDMLWRSHWVWSDHSCWEARWRILTSQWWDCGCGPILGLHRIVHNWKEKGCRETEGEEK